MFLRILDKYKRTLSVARMGKGLCNRFFIFTWLFWTPLRRRIGKPDKRVSFRLASHNQSYSIHLNGSHEEFLIFEEILGKEEYHIDTQNVAVVFDVGGNIGLSAIYFALTYPNAKIHTFEPNPHLFERLIENVAQFPNIVAHKYALGGKDGEATFHLDMEKSIASSLFPRDTTTEVTQVSVRTLDHILHALKIDTIHILKFDIEGAEYEMFQACTNLRVIKSFIGEVHEDLMGHNIDTFKKLFEPTFTLSITPCRKKFRYIVKGHLM
jgi:FkbM family methyltransferase